MAKVRSTRPPLEARIFPPDSDGHVEVELLGGEAGIAPGQACVFYEDDKDDSRILGGGFIKETLKTPEIEQALSSVLAETAAQ